MIRNLQPETFQTFGRIVPEKQHAVSQFNAHSVVLTPEEIWEYQATGETWIRQETGRTVLSVSRDGKSYVDFYLDRPVLLKDSVYFSLTSFQEQSSIQMAGISFPRLLRTGKPENRFEICPQVRILRLYTLFYQEMKPNFQHPVSRHSMMELTYVDRGILHCVADQSDLVLEPGDVTVCLPGQWHSQYAENGEAPRFVTVTFEAEGLEPALFQNRKFPKTRQVTALMGALLREQEKQNSGDMLLCLLTQLLLVLAAQKEEKKEKIQSRHSLVSENEIIRSAMQYVQHHIREKITVPVLASGIRISPSYLTVLFQKHLQLSPGEYIRRMKLQESKQMIRRGDRNFTEIAQELQYSTIHQFSRQFKEKFGITPTEYARSVRE